MKNPTKILIVDDDERGQRTLQALLSSPDSEMFLASEGRAALMRALDIDPDLILLDVMMPGIDGFQVCREIRAIPALSEVPIIMVTALDDDESRLQGLQAGADDFISKPFNRAELRARVQTITRLNRHRRLLAERSKFERLFTLAPDGIMILDNMGIIQLANPAAQKFFALPKEQALTGLELAELVPATAKASILANFLQVLAQPEQPQRREVTFANENSVVQAEVTMAFFPLDDVGGVQVIYHDITQRKTAERQVIQQLERLQAVNTIGTALNTNLELRAILDIVIEQVTEQLHADAAAIFLFDVADQTLETAAARGFRDPAIQSVRLALGAPLAGIAAQERRSITINDLQRDTDHPERIPLLLAEQFVTYHAVPLIAKGNLRGVLELMTRTPLEPSADWLIFAENLANQAAQALHTASLLADLQRTNTELIEAYDHTLAGWSRALDLRDKETRNHSQRVTEMSIALARALGLSKEQVTQIRRGALLHDIGKMGVPDGILLKPGPLTDAERQVMNSHPGYAYQLLSPIPFLHGALDIPYCHHEKWDGTGYPRGLRGQEIPPAARIFAVVDVWDALTSDRPYRKAWTPAQAIAHIRSQAGIHFDPVVVEKFMEMPWVRRDDLEI